MKQSQPHIRFYNGENDLAVANRSPYYHAPQRIEQMNVDLELLSLLLADEGDILLLRRPIPADQLAARMALLRCHVQTHLLTDSFESAEFAQEGYWQTPWGWSPRAHNQLSAAKACASEAFLAHPIAQWSEKLYQLSGKGVVCELLPQLKATLEPYQSRFVPHKIYSMEQFEAELELGLRVYKAPWSGSGKGVRFISRESCGRHDVAWVATTLKQQGYLTSAPYLHKVCDFAMQFEATADDCVEFRGYTRFHTGSHGVYQGNQLGSQTSIRQTIQQWVDPEELEAVRTQLLPLLSSEIAPHYRGYFGVDMMAFDDGEEIRIHPLVEINLRHTMGTIALHVYDRLLHPDAQGSFVVEYAPTPEALSEKLEQLEANHPLQLEDGQISKGFYCLTHRHPDSLYAAYLLVE